MKRRVRRHRDVADDIVNQAAYLLREAGQDVALRFWENAEQTIRWLAEHPGAGHLRDFDDPIESGGIYLLAAVHGARDLPPLLRRRVAKE